MGSCGARGSQARDEELKDEERGDVCERGEHKDGQGMEREEVRDDPGEDGSASCSGCSADADYGRDAGGREHVGWGGEDIG